MDIAFGPPPWLTDFINQNPAWLLTLGVVLGSSVVLYIVTRWQEFIALSVGAMLYALPFVHLS